MLKTLMHQHPRVGQVPTHLLFAYREVPQVPTGFSPLGLMYRRGRDEWEREDTRASRERLAELMGLARENLGGAQRKRKVWPSYRDQDDGSHPHAEEQAAGAWDGPFKVVKKLTEVTGGADRRLYQAVLGQGELGRIPWRACSLGPERTLRWSQFPSRTSSPGPAGRGPGGAALPPAAVLRQAGSHPPGCPPGADGHSTPVRCSPFGVTGKTAQGLEREGRDMLARGVIQPPSGPWASPAVLDPKDGSIRFCRDYWKLNAITASDACPVPRPDELLDKLGGARYLTSLDLPKGSWQV
nr:uncharacterized protein LOC102463458 [Pelodiscus sinensis]|eukprot:XP_014437188.1 uncharacterized protein LOC102463458 [Pelodiscus sinensis]